MIAPAIASVEVGTHTARLLLARAAFGNTLFRPITRERRTIRLADGFGPNESGVIQSDAAGRAAKAVGFFARVVREADGEIVRAVSTGVTRTAENRHAFIQGILDETGVRIHPISGEEEAALTARGVLNALGCVNGAYIIFDLGGGTTEFVIRRLSATEDRDLISLPLGALMIKEAFFHQDPPSGDDILAASGRVDQILSEGIPDPAAFQGTPLLIGSGGTATTLAAMVHGIEISEIGPERMNGLLLERGALETLYDRIVRMPVESRRHLTGLDPGRADVIPAGALAVLRILHYFEAARVTVCLSDILEGLLIEYLQGDGYE